MLLQRALPERDQVQHLWRLYHDHALTIVQIRFHQQSSTLRIPATAVPALKRELDDWLNSVCVQANITFLSPQTKDVFFRNLFPDYTPPDPSPFLSHQRRW
ncbi:MAG: hypothetical protein N2248_00495 [candidate division WOR-3 bacterium]|nr:hypothetical protein [candidate division WOR-3 bacterium]